MCVVGNDPRKVLCMDVRDQTLNLQSCTGRKGPVSTESRGARAAIDSTTRRRQVGAFHALLG